MIDDFNKFDCTSILSRKHIHASLLRKLNNSNFEIYLVQTIEFLVSSARNVPKVMIGVKLAKYKNTNEAKHCMCKQSLKSDRYQGIFLLISSNNPPQILQKAIKTLYMYINTNKTNNKNLYQNHFSSRFSLQIMKTQTYTLKH